jgi:acylphosphatase
VVCSAVNIIIHGKVQGVSFRVSTQTKASELSIKGWVRNLPNDTVEVHAEGNHENLDKFIKWCQKGPPFAKVSKCDLDWIMPKKINNFTIL